MKHILVLLVTLIVLVAPASASASPAKAGVLTKAAVMKGAAGVKGAAPQPTYTCTNDDCTQMSFCDLYDADCVIAYADYGYGQDYAVTSNDITGDWDAYGSSGGTCNWIAIVDYWYAHVFNSYSWVGVLQAYVCHRGQLVTRFDQVSTFAVRMFGFPWTLAYTFDYSVPTPPEQPGNLPTYYTSTTSELSVSICGIWKQICSHAHPRYVIEWNNGHLECYLNGYPFDNCVGHRYR